MFRQPGRSVFQMNDDPEIGKKKKQSRASDSEN